MPKQNTDSDRNFDDLADRFDRNIYGRLKGRIRLAVLERDFSDFLPIAPFVPLVPERRLNILDAGGGQGQFSLPFAQAGHRLALCDLSSKMLDKARQRAAQLAASDVQFLHCAIQELDPGSCYDLVLCHAVLEWVVEPQRVLQSVWEKVRPGGHLSLLFYNQHSIVYKNLLRTNYQKVLQGDYRAYRGSLTPINPLIPDTVMTWCEELGGQCICHSGIRVFHDYIMDPEARRQDPEAVLALELSLSRQAPYRGLGRYVHYLLKKPEASALTSDFR